MPSEEAHSKRFIRSRCAAHELMCIDSPSSTRSQVQAINRAFSPSTDAIARAVRIIEQNEENEAAGKGAFGFSEGGGRTMIDAPMVRSLLYP